MTTNALEEALGFNLYRTALLFRREILIALEPWAMTTEQWQVLMALGRAECTQRELAELTLTDKHTLSRMLDKLERDGWIERDGDPDDRRAVRVRATAHARAELPGMVRAANTHFRPILASLTPQQHAQLMASLKTLRAHLEDRS